MNRAHRVSIKRSGMQGHLEKQVGRGAKRGTGVLGGAGGTPPGQAKDGLSWPRKPKTHTHNKHTHTTTTENKKETT